MISICPIASNPHPASHNVIRFNKCMSKDSQSKTSFPLTFRIHPTPSTSATAFLISSSEAITCLHACPQGPPNVAGYTTSITSVNPIVDLALLSLPSIPSLRNYIPKTFTKPHRLGLHYVVVLTSPKRPIPLSLISLSTVTYVFSSIQLPALLFRSLHADINFHGASGACVVNQESGEIVGIITQVAGPYVHAIPSCYVKSLIKSKTTHSIPVVPSFADNLIRIHGIATRDGLNVRYGGILAPVNMAVACCKVGDIVSVILDHQNGPRKLRIRLQSAWEKRVDEIVSAGPFLFTSNDADQDKCGVIISGFDVNQAIEDEWDEKNNKHDQLICRMVVTCNGVKVNKLMDLLEYSKCCGGMSEYKLDDGTELQLRQANIYGND